MGTEVSLNFEVAWWQLSLSTVTPRVTVMTSAAFGGRLIGRKLTEEFAKL